VHRSSIAERLEARATLAMLCWTAVAAVAPAVAQRSGALGPLDDGRVSYFIAPPDDAQSRPGDAELALWALEAWQRAANGTLSFEPAASEGEALVRVYWAAAAGGQYGEMRALDVDGRRGAAVFIRPDTSALGDDIATRARLDALFRDTIVYLTCLHELGHALGLVHTDDFADVMYFFGFGGDIPEFFDRYRRELQKRNDIRAVSGLSAGDHAQLRALYRYPTGLVADAN
jgi:matrixin